ncbi:MAG: precorrin-2 dehydrogenase/sirohydrochlorin ferrochelatase family protein [Candidatus Binatia bacterium]
MAYYPIALELTGRSCLVIGGGPVAERKIEGLLTAEAMVTVISPALTPRLEEWAITGQIRHIGRAYRPGDLAGAQLVFAASDDQGVNAAVSREGQERRVWVNAADDPAHCDFILPAILRRGELIVATTTGGASPALAAVVRDELETVLGPDYTVLAQVAAEVRQELRARQLSLTGEHWRRALRLDALRRLIQEGRVQEAKAYLLERLEEGGDSHAETV